MLDIVDPFSAYCLDQAVIRFGMSVEKELEEVTGKSDSDINRQRQVIWARVMQIPFEQRVRKFTRPKPPKE